MLLQSLSDFAKSTAKDRDKDLVNRWYLMAYTPDYAEGDLSNSIIDTIVKVIITVSTFVTLIVLVLLWGWLKRNMK